MLLLAVDGGHATVLRLVWRQHRNSSPADPFANHGARFGQCAEIFFEASGERIVDDRDDGDFAERRTDLLSCFYFGSSKNVSVRLICIAILPRFAVAGANNRLTTLAIQDRYLMIFSAG